MTSLDQLKLESSTTARICARHHVAELSVFGSTARANAGPDGDIDLLVSFQPNAPVGLVAFDRLRRELEDALGRWVDPVPKDGLKPIIRKEVLAGAQVLNAV